MPTEGTAKNTAVANKSVAAEAKRWAVRFDNLSDTERLQFERWLQESDAHRAEFDAAMRQWQSLDFLQLLHIDPVNHKADVTAMEETPEQAAQGISTALAFLRREADAIGMHDVGKIIGQAFSKSCKYRSTH